MEKQGAGDLIGTHHSILGCIKAFLEGLGSLEFDLTPEVEMLLQTKLLYVVNSCYGLNKFCYVTAIAFTNLLTKGFCTPPE